MKKLIKLSLVAFLLATTINVHASTTAVIIKTVGESKELVLSVNGMSSKEIKLTILDNNDIQLHFEKFNNVKETYNKAYSFNQLPNGNYFLEIETDFLIEIHTVTLTADSLIINETNRQVIFKPQMRQLDNMVFIKYYTSPSGKMALSINDRNQGVIYKDELNDEADTKSYDLSALKPGFYTVNFNYENRFFSRTLELK